MNKNPVLDILSEIEAEFILSDIRLEGEPAWGIFRSIILWALVISRRENTEAFNLRPKFSQLPRVKNLLRSPPQLSCKAIVISSTSLLRKHNGHWIDKEFHWLNEHLGRENVLNILVDVADWSPAVKSVHNPNYRQFSSDWFLLRGLLASRLGKTPKLEGAEILHKIETKYGLNLKISKKIRMMLRFREDYRRLFLKAQPKALFVTGYYSIHVQSAIWAAKSLGLPTVEFQHGIINTTHPAYMVSQRDSLDPFFPDHFFSYGPTVKKDMAESLLFESVFDVGQGFLSLLSENRVPSVQLSDRLNMFSKSVAVTLQPPIRDKLLDLGLSVARKAPEILFLIIPRDFSNLPSTEGWPLNMLLWSEDDFYRTIPFVNAHITGYSTTAVEASAFGIPNVLCDIGGLASNTLSHACPPSRFNRYVENESQLELALIDILSLDLDGIEVPSYYSKNHRQRLQDAMAAIGI